VPSPREVRDASPLEALERFARSLDREFGSATRVDADPEKVEQGLARLVLTLVIDVLRRVMERQAMRRLEAGTLTNDQIECLGRTFLLLESRMRELLDAFGLEESDLELDLGLDVDDLD
jgi:gas vesicle protein GvpK